MASVSSSRPSSSSPSVSGFGTNEWLVEEMYQQFLADPSSVDQAWHEFFADYRPGSPVSHSADREAGAAPAGGTPSRPARSATPSGNPLATSGRPQRSNGAAGRPATRPAPEPQREAAPPSTGTGNGSGAGSAAKAPQRAPAEKLQPEAAPAEEQRPKAAPAATKEPAPSGDGGPAQTPLRGAAAAVVKNMNASLTVPTATSVRAVPAKLLADNRVVINNHLARARGGKVSFTHLIGYALVRALDDFPNMNSAFAEVDGKPVLVRPEHVNFGLAIDLPKPDGSRSLVVASIKAAEEMDFAQFWGAYEDIIRRARNGKLTMDDFTGTTISLTNPGTIGTVHSVPRLTAGQGAIIGVGAMEYPAEFQGMNPEALAEMAVSKIITLTSTRCWSHSRSSGSVMCMYSTPTVRQ